MTKVPSLATSTPRRARHYRTVAFNQLSLYIACNQIPGITADKVVAPSQVSSPENRHKGPPTPRPQPPSFTDGETEARLRCDLCSAPVGFAAFPLCKKGGKENPNPIFPAADPIVLPRCPRRGRDLRGSRSAGITGLGFEPHPKILLVLIFPCCFD